MLGLASRFIGRPLALLPDHAGFLHQALRDGAAYAVDDADEAAARDYSVTASVAIVPVIGALSHGRAWGWCEGTSYEAIWACIAHASKRSDIRAIALHVNSPGGDVAGMMTLAQKIYDLRGEKPIWAILDETAYSAAYALASACDVITVPQTGGTGSIGVVILHADINGMLDKAGVKVTTITYGDRKADGYPTQPMNGDALVAAQASVDTLGEMFVELVARNRNLSPKKVRAMEGGTFLGRAGVFAGLADHVAAPSEALGALIASLPRQSAAA